jgi:hypothetical protein
MDRHPGGPEGVAGWRRSRVAGVAAAASGSDPLARAQVSIQGLPDVVVLLMGLDSSAAGINALSWCANTAKARAEYLLTRRQMLGKGAPD